MSPLPSTSTKPALPSGYPPPECAFASNTDLFTRLHQSQEFSDCKIVCGPYHFNLHKVILASHSDYFKTAFKTGTFKVYSSCCEHSQTKRADSRQQGLSGTIKLKAIQKDSEYSSEAEDVCDDPEIVKLMVEYFYHYDYLRDADHVPVQDDVQPTIPPGLGYQSAQSNANAALIALSNGQYGNANLVAHANPVAPVSSPRQSKVHIIEHAEVFAMAVKYQVESLRDLAAAKFKQSAEMDWDHEDFAEAISIVHSSTDESVSQLRNIVADVIHEHFEALQDKGVETVICEIPRLAYDLLKRKREQPKPLVDTGHHNESCPRCSQPLSYFGPAHLPGSGITCYSCGYSERYVG